MHPSPRATFPAWLSCRAGRWELVCGLLPSPSPPRLLLEGAPELLLDRLWLVQRLGEEDSRQTEEALPTLLGSFPAVPVPTPLQWPFPRSALCSPLCSSMMVARPIKPVQNNFPMSLKFPTQLPTLQLPQEATVPFSGRSPGPTHPQSLDTPSPPSHPAIRPDALKPVLIHRHPGTPLQPYPPGYPQFRCFWPTQTPPIYPVTPIPLVGSSQLTHPAPEGRMMGGPSP